MVINYTIQHPKEKESKTKTSEFYYKKRRNIILFKKNLNYPFKIVNQFIMKN